MLNRRSRKVSPLEAQDEQQAAEGPPPLLQQDADADLSADARANGEDAFVQTQRAANDPEELSPMHIDGAVASSTVSDGHAVADPEAAQTTVDRTSHQNVSEEPVDYASSIVDDGGDSSKQSSAAEDETEKNIESPQLAQSPLSEMLNEQAPSLPRAPSSSTSLAPPPLSLPTSSHTSSRRASRAGSSFSGNSARVRKSRTGSAAVVPSPTVIEAFDAVRRRHTTPRGSSHTIPNVEGGLPEIITEHRYIPPQTHAVEPPKEENLMHIPGAPGYIALACCFIHDAMHGRLANGRNKMYFRPVRIQQYFLLHTSAGWKYFVLGIILAFCALVFFEPPTTVNYSQDASICELIFLVVLFADSLLKIGYMGFKVFLSKKWNKIAAFFLVLYLVDALISISTHGHSFRFSRPFRPMIFLARHRDIRNVYNILNAMLKRLIHVFSIMFVFVAFFALIGIHVFSDEYEVFYADQPHLQGAFDNTAKAFVRLFVLFSTENYPNVIRPAFQKDSASFAYFFIFLYIGVFFLAAILLGLIVSVYFDYASKQLNKERKKEWKGLFQAFQLLDVADVGGVTIETWFLLLKFLRPDATRTEAKFYFELLDRDHNDLIDCFDFLDLREILLLSIKPASLADIRPVFVKEWPKWKIALFTFYTSSKWYRRLVSALLFINLGIAFAYFRDISEQLLFIFTGIHLALATLFFVEIVLSVYIRGRRKYFESAVRAVEMGCVLAAWVCHAIGGIGLFLEMGAERTFLIFQLVGNALLFIRFLTMNKELRFGVALLSNLIGMILHLSLFIVFLMYFFAVIGMEAFKGIESVTGSGYFADFNCAVGFDNMPCACFALFQVLTTSNWHEPMNDLILSAGWRASVFFIVYFLVMSLTLMDLIVAVTIDAFLSARKHYQGLSEDNIHTAFVEIPYEPEEEDFEEEDDIVSYGSGDSDDSGEDADEAERMFEHRSGDDGNEQQHFVFKRGPSNEKRDSEVEELASTRPKVPSPRTNVATTDCDPPPSSQKDSVPLFSAPFGGTADEQVRKSSKIDFFTETAPRYLNRPPPEIVAHHTPEHRQDKEREGTVDDEQQQQRARGSELEDGGEATSSQLLPVSHGSDEMPSDHAPSILKRRAPEQGSLPQLSSEKAQGNTLDTGVTAVETAQRRKSVSFFAEADADSQDDDTHDNAARNADGAVQRLAKDAGSTPSPQSEASRASVASRRLSGLSSSAPEQRTGRSLARNRHSSFWGRRSYSFWGLHSVNRKKSIKSASHEDQSEAAPTLYKIHRQRQSWRREMMGEKEAFMTVSKNDIKKLKKYIRAPLEELHYRKSRRRKQFEHQACIRDLEGNHTTADQKKHFLTLSKISPILHWWAASRTADEAEEEAMGEDEAHHANEEDSYLPLPLPNVRVEGSLKAGARAGDVSQFDVGEVGGSSDEEEEDDNDSENSTHSDSDDDGDGEARNRAALSESPTAMDGVSEAETPSKLIRRLSRKSMDNGTMLHQGSRGTSFAKASTRPAADQISSVTSQGDQAITDQGQGNDSAFGHRDAERVPRLSLDANKPRRHSLQAESQGSGLTSRPAAHTPITVRPRKSSKPSLFLVSSKGSLFSDTQSSVVELVHGNASLTAEGEKLTSSSRSLKLPHVESPKAPPRQRRTSAPAVASLGPGPQQDTLAATETKELSNGELARSADHEVGKKGDPAEQSAPPQMTDRRPASQASRTRRKRKGMKRNAVSLNDVRKQREADKRQVQPEYTTIPEDGEYTTPPTADPTAPESAAPRLKQRQSKRRVSRKVRVMFLTDSTPLGVSAEEEKKFNEKQQQASSAAFSRKASKRAGSRR